MLFLMILWILIYYVWNKKRNLLKQVDTTSFTLQAIFAFSPKYTRVNMIDYKCYLFNNHIMFHHSLCLTSFC